MSEIVTEIKKPSFQNKLDNKAKKLPEPSTAIASLIEALHQLELNDLEAVKAWAEFEMRRKALESAADAPYRPESGDRVVICNSEVSRFNGQRGVVEKVNRIRCTVKLDDGRNIYVFLSNVIPETSSNV